MSSTVKKILTGLRKAGINLKLIDDKLVVDSNNNLDNEIHVLIREYEEEIKGYLNEINGIKRTKIPLAVPSDSYPASSSQRRLWVQHQMDPNSTAYNITTAYTFDGNINCSALKASVEEMFARHEILRTVLFENAAGSLRQRILGPLSTDFSLHIEDLAQDKDSPEVSSLIEGEFKHRFDLSTGPLVRCSLFRLSDDNWIFCLVMHHIVSDGWSMDIFIRELLSLYQSNCAGELNALAPLRIQYKDYASWQQEQLVTGVFETHKKYWLEQFSGELPVLSGLGDLIRPDTRATTGSVFVKALCEDDISRLKTYVQQEGGSIFMGFLSLLSILLYKYTSQSDMIIGCPIAGRDQADLSGQIGFYLNMLALRTRVDTETDFRSVFQGVRKVTLEAYEHQSFPFDELIEALAPVRESGRAPLFDVLIDYHDNRGGVGQQDVGDFRVGSFGGTEHSVSKYDLTFMFIEHGEGVNLMIEYNDAMFTAPYVERLHHHFSRLMHNVLSAPEEPLDTQHYLSSVDKSQILEEFNVSFDSQREFRSFLSMFGDCVKKYPDFAAIVNNGKSTSYRQLEAQSDLLADILFNDYGVKKGDAVGVMADRSEELIISILGIMKSGGVYVPISPDFPEGRKEHIIADSEISVLLTQASYLYDVSFFSGAMFMVDVQLGSESRHYESHPKVDLTCNDGAYIIYTSGSTGQPKGCIIDQGNLSNYLQWANGYYFTELAHINFAFFTSIGVDLTITSIFCPLSCGGTISIYGAEQTLSDTFGAIFSGSSTVNCLKLTPSHIDYLGELDLSSSNLECIIAGGERLLEGQVNVLVSSAPHAKIYNEYGPTETTVGCTVKEIKLGDEITIGRPIDGVAAYILDEKRGICGIGIQGELGISGKGVGQGYLNQAELTEKRFIADPYRPGERIYLTGDICCWRADGELEYKGRRDSQVKVRGHRIELEEIESVLNIHPYIRQAAVIQTEDNSMGMLEAFYVSEEPIDRSEIATFLERALPDYMIPALFTKIDQVPMSASGKRDLKALRQLSSKNHDIDNVIKPSSGIESELLKIWNEVLGTQLERVGSYSDFFQLGGNSLTAIKLLGLINKSYSTKLDLKDMFIHKTFIDQLNIIRLNYNSGTDSIPLAAPSDSYPASSSQRRLWVQHQMDPNSTAYNITTAYTFDGNINCSALKASVEEMFARHEILRTVLFENAAGSLRQRILGPLSTDFSLHIEDLAQDKDSPEVSSLIEGEFKHRFDLSTGPLVRCSLFRLSDDNWIFCLVMHHIVSDGWSMDIFIRELLSLYQSNCAGELNALAPLRIQYKDYASWQQEQLVTGVFETHKKYWLEQFSGELPVLSGLGDLIRPDTRATTGSVFVKALCEDDISRLKTYVQQEGGSIFMGFLSLLSILLYKYTSQSDMIIGCPIAGRDQADLSGQIGFYLNMLALRTRVDTETDFRSVFQGVRKVTLEAYEHQSFPFDELIEALAPVRESGRAPLFDVLIDYHDNRGGVGQQDVGDFRVGSFGGTEHSVSKYDLTFMFIEHGEGVNLMIEYNDAMFTAPYVERLHHHFSRLMHNVLSAPEEPLDTQHYLSSVDKSQILEEFNVSFDSQREFRSFLSMFGDCVKKYPDFAAIVNNGKSTSYRQLEAQSDLLADILFNDYGVKKGDAVGVMADRSEELIISILGIMKSGGVYVPISPDFPEGRKEHIIADSEISVLLTQASYLYDVSFFSGAMFMVDVQLGSESRHYESHPKVDLTCNDGAYIIYTSGSTGQPKGCIIDQGNLSNYLQWANGYYFTELAHINFAFFTSIGVDLTITSIFCPLSCGGTISIYGAEQTLSDTFGAIFSGSSTVNCLKLTPSHIDYLGELDLSSSNLECIIAGGERLLEGQVNVLVSSAPHAKIYNEYGPTETTVGCTVKEIKLGDEITIGRPIDGVAAYILDEKRGICGIGIQGELGISGKGVGQGYLNQAELTEKRFIADPYRPGERIYLTGDICCWRADGELEYKGRRDSQVKVRGHRIELEEIESVLNIHPYIRQAAVIQTEDNSMGMLEAFYVSEEPIDRSEIATFLERALPDYMIPALFTKIDQVPMSASGKRDLKALRQLSSKNHDINNVIKPSNNIENALIEIVEEVLLVNNIGLQSNFFDLGGDSIKSIQIVSRLKKKGYFLTIQDVLLFPELNELKNHITENITDSDQGTIEGKVLLGPIQKYFFTTTKIDYHHYNQSVLLEISKDLNTEVLKGIFQRIIHHHDALRMRFAKTEHEWNQFNLGHEDNEISFSVIEEEEYFDFEKYCNEIQRSFNLEKGPLIKIYLFRKSSDSDRLLIIAHHLVVDGVSWRIIFEDLAILIDQYYTNKEFELPKKSDSFKYWMEWQTEYVASGQLEEEKQYWGDVNAKDVVHLKKDIALGTNLQKDSGTKYFKLDEKTTELFVTKMNNNDYKAVQKDILLAVLSLSLSQIFETNQITVNLEGHGRESLAKNIDVSRTVGWFTTLYPVHFEVKNKENLLSHLLDCQAKIQEIPNNGFGFGALKYLGGMPYQILPEVTFNYLGDFGRGVELKEKKQLFRFIGDQVGDQIPPDRERSELINISAIIVDRSLHVNITYSKEQFLDSTMDDLLSSFKNYLCKYIELLSSDPAQNEKTKNLTFQGLSQTEIEKINSI